MDRRNEDGQPILIIDDDPSVLSGIATFLELAGYKTITAQNGAEALEKLKSATPSLILLDLLMPVMDGRQFIESLRQPEYASRHDIPVILMTVKEYGAQIAEELGVDSLLRKPFQPRELLQVIEHVSAKETGDRNPSR